MFSDFTYALIKHSINPKGIYFSTESKWWVKIKISSLNFNCTFKSWVCAFIYFQKSTNRIAKPQTDKM